MTTFTVAIPVSFYVSIEANSAGEITEEMVEEVVMNTHGKYVEVSTDNVDNFYVID